MKTLAVYKQTIQDKYPKEYLLLSLFNLTRKLRLSSEVSVAGSIFVLRQTECGSRSVVGLVRDSRV